MRELSPGITEADVRLQLAEEDGEALEKGNLPLHDVTPAAMVIEMLEIESIQYVAIHTAAPAAIPEPLTDANLNKSTPRAFETGLREPPRIRTRSSSPSATRSNAG